MVNLRLPSNAVEAYIDGMHVAAGDNLDTAMITINHKRCSPDALERIAELSARWADIVRLIRHTHHVIKRLLERRCRQTWSVILHGYSIALDGDGNGRYDACLFTSIKRVINQFFDKDNRPEVANMADLHLKLFLGEELHRAMGGKRCSIECSCHSFRMPPRTCVRPPVLYLGSACRQAAGLVVLVRHRKHRHWELRHLLQDLGIQRAGSGDHEVRVLQDRFEFKPARQEAHIDIGIAVSILAQRPDKFVAPRVDLLQHVVLISTRES